MSCSFCFLFVLLVCIISHGFVCNINNQFKRGNTQFMAFSAVYTSKLAPSEHFILFDPTLSMVAIMYRDHRSNNDDFRYTLPVKAWKIPMALPRVIVLVEVAISLFSGPNLLCFVSVSH
ncbi:hypothetical protein QVD17_27313 [Tagetes erecta]|uniref:Secreted protein n=1 Tax=Tagetes erecta TaxID=13708 RepID=A0AAD8NRI3_TARER|nr:hypothetical protein QVD17_27313 [Tagetes erecta]